MPLYAFPPPKSALEIWLPIIGGCLIVLVVGLIAVALYMYWQSRRFEGRDAAEGADNFQVDITQFERLFEGKHALVIEALIFEAEKGCKVSEDAYKQNVGALAQLDAKIVFMQKWGEVYRLALAERATIVEQVAKSKRIHTQGNAAWEAMMIAYDRMKRDGKIEDYDHDTYLRAAKKESKASVLTATNKLQGNWEMVKAYLLAKDTGM